jgi:hypothetical protein
VAFLGLELKKDQFFYNLHQEDWSLLSKKLSTKVNGDYVLITSAGVKSAYFIGDFSYDMNRSILENTDTGNDFGLDRRTGRRAIYTITALEEIISHCYPILIILEKDHVNGVAVNKKVVDILNRKGTKIDMNIDRFMVWIINDVYTRENNYNDKFMNDTVCKKVSIS